ncbi:MAG: hypothetical protein J6X65_05765 [Bacteroidales bacterium]|nr:hypothetical protein [Bacteroidales bacterium]
MKHILQRTILCLLMLCAIPAFAQNVSNVTATQQGKQIIITYDLDKTANISVRVSTNGGRVYGMPLQKVTGHVGKRVPAGKKRTIVWNVLEEREQLVEDQVVFQVEAEPIHPEKQKKQNIYAPSWHIFGLVDVSLPFSEMTVKPFDFTNLSYGFSVGMYKRVGWYISAVTNFNYKGAFHPFTDGDYELTGLKKFSRISATAGLVVNTCKPLSVYVGAGYGYRSLNCETEDGKWYSYPTRTFMGCDVAAGILLNLGGFALSANMVTTNFKYYELKMGIGFCIEQKKRN